MAQITLTIPAKPDFVHIPRSVVAGVAASLDFSYDDIEDLRLAVDEACAYLLAIEGSATGLCIRVDPSGRVVRVRASLQAAGAQPPPPGGPGGLVWHILAALTDGAELEQTADGPAVRFTKRPAG